MRPADSPGGSLSKTVPWRLAVVENETAEIQVITTPRDGGIGAKVRSNDGQQQVPTRPVFPPGTPPLAAFFPIIIIRTGHGRLV
jgi:hypothetical protein